MSKIQVITVCHDATHAKPLLDSLERHGWDFVCIRAEWKGFGTKLIATYQYLKEHPEVTEFIFVDAFDVICLGGEDEFREKLESNYPDADMVCSGERGLWPLTLEQYRPLYTKHRHRFDYINSGCYYAKSEAFTRLMDFSMPKYESDDQEWMNMAYLCTYTVLKQTIDNNQILFNSHSFIDEGEYTYENGRVGINGNLPLFTHFNGRSPRKEVDEMLKNI